jgi:hypothetical protein
MISREVCGVPLDDFSDYIRVALASYASKTDGHYGFDIDNAAHLDYVTGKLTARSQTDVMRGDEKVADLFVIAFAPEDGTGDNNTYTLDQLNMGCFPDDKKYFPRSKSAVHSEVHLTIAAKKTETMNDPVLFAGHLSVLGLIDTNSVAEVGYVGQESHSFARSLVQGIGEDREVRPMATLTTGYERGLYSTFDPGERFGDPHAILNRVQYAIQVAGFIAITPDAAPEHLELLRQLDASEFILHP